MTHTDLCYGSVHKHAGRVGESVRNACYVGPSRAEGTPWKKKKKSSWDSSCWGLTRAEECAFASVPSIARSILNSWSFFFSKSKASQTQNTDQMDCFLLFFISSAHGICSDVELRLLVPDVVQMCLDLLIAACSPVWITRWNVGSEQYWSVLL